MTFEITKKFKKQVDLCTDLSIRMQIGKIFQEIASAEKLSEIKHLKKLKGSKNSFRIRLGNYRIGILIQNDTVIFAAFDHRSDIYKYFP